MRKNHHAPERTQEEWSQLLEDRLERMRKFLAALADPGLSEEKLALALSGAVSESALIIDAAFHAGLPLFSISSEVRKCVVEAASGEFGPMHNDPENS